MISSPHSRGVTGRYRACGTLVSFELPAPAITVRKEYLAAVDASSAEPAWAEQGPARGEHPPLPVAPHANRRALVGPESSGQLLRDHELVPSLRAAPAFNSRVSGSSVSSTASC